VRNFFGLRIYLFILNGERRARSFRSENVIFAQLPNYFVTSFGISGVLHRRTSSVAKEPLFGHTRRSTMEHALRSLNKLPRYLLSMLETESLPLTDGDELKLEVPCISRQSCTPYKSHLFCPAMSMMYVYSAQQLQVADNPNKCT